MSNTAKVGAAISLIASVVIIYTEYRSYKLQDEMKQHNNDLRTRRISPEEAYENAEKTYEKSKTNTKTRLGSRLFQTLGDALYVFGR